MPRTEILAASWITLLDRHVRIAESDDDNLAGRILDVDSTLLALARRVERIVQRHLLTLVKVTFLGEGGFHLGVSPVSAYLLNASYNDALGIFENFSKVFAVSAALLYPAEPADRANAFDMTL